MAYDIWLENGYIVTRIFRVKKSFCKQRINAIYFSDDLAVHFGIAGVFVVIDQVRTSFDEVARQTTHFLSRNIAAIQVVPHEREASRLGVITQLPEGAQLDPCGDGFDERTIKVKWQGCCYFVFLQDLEADRLQVVSTSRSW